VAAVALSVGLVGAGNISRAHLPAYRSHPEVVRLAAVCDQVPARAAEVAAAFGLPRYWTDVDAFLREAEVEAVDVLLPHRLHYPVVKAALEAGKHVLVEKPFVTRVAEARELVALAAQRGLTLMVAQMQRYHARYVALRRLLAEGALGAVRHGRVDAIQNLHDYAEPPHWLYDGAQAGGGGVISVAVHRLDLLRYLIGDARRVVAWGRTVDPAFRAAEDYCVALIEFECGALVDLFSTYSAAALPYGEMFWLFADRAVVHTLPAEGEYLRAVPRIAYREGTKSGRRFVDVEPVPGVLPTEDPFVNEILHWAECVRTGREPWSSGRDNLGTIALVEAIYRSLARGGEPVSLAEVLADP
jgi:predicted dehydrogenase